MITIASINERLSLGLTGKFVEEELGVTPTEKDKKSGKWTEEQYSGPICDALIRWIDGKRGAKVVAVAKPKPAAAAETFDMGGEAAASEGFSMDDSAPSSDEGFDTGEVVEEPAFEIEPEFAMT